MGNIIPRVAAIHDLSGLGRCSLTVLIPVLSTLGIQVCPVPTAVLSTQTDGFEDFFFEDFSNSIKETGEHWKEEGISFDCIYSGFLGSARQIELVKEFFCNFQGRSKPLIVVDPVMGDNGSLYSTYTAEMQEKMRYLVEKADVITPNLTEACFLLNEPFLDKPLDIQEIKSYLKRLSGMGPETVVITGIQVQGGSYTNAGYKRSQDSFWKADYQRFPAHYPGTGDIYTSVLTGSLLKGDSLPVAMERASQFISLAIRLTYGYRTPEREGVLLEKALPWLQRDMSAINYEKF